MKLRPDQLQGQLQRELRPVYLVSGDEPFQLGEAADAVRRRARELGFSDREVLEQGAGFDWQALTSAADSLSLFAEKRVLDLRLSSPRVGTDGSQALCDYTERLPEDTVLLITVPKLDASQQKSKWVKALDKAGVLIQVWPLEGRNLQRWIEQRLRGRGLRPEPEVVALLADRVEGNLLAAAQEIDKLRLVCGEGAVSVEQLLATVADSARFDVFGLVDTLLQGDGVRGLRILAGLRGEDVPPAVVLWALAREIRALAGMAFEIEAGTPQERVFSAHRVWERRRPLVSKGLKRFRSARWRALLRSCARVDRIIKGREAGADPWRAMEDLVLAMAGVPVFSDRISASP